jgi:quinol monooxygenase YgiN
VNKEAEDTFKHNADELTAATRKLDGCIVFVYSRHQPYEGEPPDAESVEYLIYEDWETVKQFKNQWESDHLKTFQNSVFALLTGPPDLTFYRGWLDAVGEAHLPKTGQEHCYDTNGKVVACEGTGQDGDYQTGASSPVPRFTDNNNGTVTDNLTGLIWLKNANLFGEVMRDEAIEKVKSLTGGSCGLSDGSKAGDWRLPNVNELESLLEFNNSSGPCVATPNPFSNLQVANYWSSTSVAAFPALGWYVALAVGCPVFDLTFNRMRMWPVRGESTLVPKTGQKKCWALDKNEPSGVKEVSCKGTGQDGEFRAGVAWPNPRFSDNNNGTVTDHSTGLVWLRDGNAFGTQSWQKALELCNSLCSGQHELTDGSKPGDWRLPNINELRSLEDYGQHTPAIAEKNPFKNIRNSLCWSSTTVASAPSLARFLFVGIGSCVWDHKEVLMGVWPVRDGAK